MSRDWHAERYAAGEALARAVKGLLAEYDRRDAIPVLRDQFVRDHGVPNLRDCLAAYEATKDAP